MGSRTALITMSSQAIGRMSCNPAIGGIAKGQLVREIDALGGQMGLTADATGIHFRMLNTSKGAAVHSPRCQSDKLAYSEMMEKVVLDSSVEIVEGMVEELLVGASGVEGLRVSGIGVLQAPRVVITSGTFMNGVIHRGEERISAGRVDEPPSLDLPKSLRSLGFETQRLKTGTPPRVRSGSIDTSVLEVQEGDPIPSPFSFRGAGPACNQVHCHIAWTTEKSHRVILDNMEKIPLYNGQIEGIGPRYCPSIEDKVCRFSDRDRHQIFVEPETLRTDEVYLNGISTSMEATLQDELLRSIRGFEKAEVIRYGYAIEYDFIPPHQLRETMESRLVPGLYLAGQINGTTGYEEAAAQGLMAGINAVLSLKGEAPFILGRNEAYVGVLMDDLVTKEISEPYRMFTSRAEYRLVLRQDNADRRLMSHGHRLGLIDQETHDKLQRKVDRCDAARKEMEREYREGKSLLEILRQPASNLPSIVESEASLNSLQELELGDLSSLEFDIKYEGYLKREHSRIERLQRADGIRLPEHMDYGAITEMRAEGREKLARFRPSTLGQASRIAGVNPADLQILEIYLKRGHWPVLEGSESA